MPVVSLWIIPDWDTCPTDYKWDEALWLTEPLGSGVFCRMEYWVKKKKVYTIPFFIDCVYTKTVSGKTSMCTCKNDLGSSVFKIVYRSVGQKNTPVAYIGLTQFTVNYLDKNVSLFSLLFL